MRTDGVMPPQEPRRNRRVLIVSPHFPPVNAPDMQRVRMSLPFFRAHGWDPYVLAVAPIGGESIDPILAETIPADVPVVRVPSLPARVAQRLGVGNVALRAMPWLYRSGSELIRTHGIDLVYFSTTMFLSMPLGRIWRRQFGVPFVLDIQDPWLSDYYETHPDVAAPPKYAAAHRVHATLEPWTMRKAGGLIAVSDAYIATLRRRYPWIAEECCATIPFAASETDAAFVQAHPQANTIFTRQPGELHTVSIGRGGDDIAPALRILFEAVARVAAARPGAPSPHLHFVGTDYATDARARKTVEPVAASTAAQLSVTERTSRIPYFEALQVMQDADFLLLVGSDDPQYTASKVYPYLLSRKAIVAVVHEKSGLVPLLTRAGAVLATFGSTTAQSAVEGLVPQLASLLERLPARVELPAEVVAACSADDMTRRQCAVFDRVLEAA